ncbi:hypothetical protein PVK06_029191 [Gossypium arboreum]|uniref:Zinc knuckle CX2CX4HX4C domain-containing protein n=1 Tax=Gossypium arboreum TaxID=29729 RepID=A0ABR0P610_GOSAR|nr:hypothetical protein PVK06_029191 [Gossypium arboreum]
MPQQFENFLGQFVDYDAAAVAKGFRAQMRVWARLDFQYEHLKLFCFVCDRLGYTSFSHTTMKPRIEEALAIREALSSLKSLLIIESNLVL